MGLVGQGRVFREGVVRQYEKRGVRFGIVRVAFEVPVDERNFGFRGWLSGHKRQLVLGQEFGLDSGDFVRVDATLTFGARAFLDENRADVFMPFQTLENEGISSVVEKFCKFIDPIGGECGC